MSSSDVTVHSGRFLAKGKTVTAGYDFSDKFGMRPGQARQGCTLGDYWRFGSRLIDMTQCLHSGIPTLMTTSIWRDFSHLTPVWT
jgi:hypothetical protein